MVLLDSTVIITVNKKLKQKECFSLPVFFQKKCLTKGLLNECSEREAKKLRTIIFENEWVKQGTRNKGQAKIKINYTILQQPMACTSVHNILLEFNHYFV